jgi:hypothetical protein
MKYKTGNITKLRGVHGKKKRKAYTLPSIPSK